MAQQPPHSFCRATGLVSACRLLLACTLALGAPAPGIAAQTPPAGTRPGEEVAVSDTLLAGGDAEGAYAALMERLAAEPGDFEARWRAVRIAVALSVVGADHTTRRLWAVAADEHGRALLRLRPEDPEALAWGAAARGRRALNEEGMREPARLANETWALTEALLSGYPDHPLGNHVRGKLSQQMAGLAPAARFFGRVLLGGAVLKHGTWEEAEKYHLRAVRGDPGMVFFYLDLGETYAAQGKAAAAAAVFRSGLALRERYPMDAAFKRLISQRLAALGGHPGEYLHYN